MSTDTPTVKVFRYIAELEAFVVTEEYQRLAETLGLVEWTPVVWIGRLLTQDNDYGEHWFDNWELREERRDRARALGFDEHELLIIDPQHFQDGRDGPRHDPAQRKRFWTDVLQSLTLSYEVLFHEARLMNEQRQQWMPEDAIPDLEDHIARIRTAR